MKTWKLILEYDGSKYSGWQEQLNARTVMGELRQAAESFFGEPVELHGAGRTDAGVHALGQVAHLRARITRNVNLQQLQRKLNDELPAEIAVLSIEEAQPRFHARHDAISRSYVYQVSMRKNAFAKRHVWWVKEPLDIERMRQAVQLLVGRHDFVCFRAMDPSKPKESTLVDVELAEIEQHEDLLLIRITASHFLWRMVRRVVGVVVKLGLGEISIEDFHRLLAGKCGNEMKVSEWTAPAAGLFLETVTYR